jgi:serine/threonine protein phosphatase PrpC
MEDRVHAMFGVFGGHGGKSVVEFIAENMPGIIAEELAQERHD